jgi:hypothetical protein
MTLDTLEYMKRLEAAGVDRRQAEAHAQAVRDTVAPQLATKSDLDAAVAKLEAKIGSEVARLEAKIGSEVARLDGKIDTAVARLEGKLVLVQWMLGFNLAATVAVLWRLLR